MNEAGYIKICLQQVENKLKWKSTADWTDSDYRKLSEVVKEASGISISHQTLKRLFGKVNYKEAYNPQQATKDALSKYLGYTDWDEFIRKNQTDEPLREPQHFVTQHSGSGSIWKLIIIIIIIITGLCLWFTVRKPEQYSLSAKNPSGVVPHTVEFDYDISGLQEDSVYLDFGYTHPVLGYQKVLLDKKKKRINHCFQIPYLYKVRLTASGKTLAEVPVHACSGGWSCLFKGSDVVKGDVPYLKHESVYQYGLDDFIIDTVKDGQLYFAPQTLYAHGMESRKVYYLENRNIRHFNADGDDCMLEVQFQNSPASGGISCFDSRFMILGNKNQAEVILMQKGCSRWSGVRISDVVKDGQYDDMSALSCDLGRMRDLKIRIHNRQATIILDSDTLYTCRYSQPLDTVKGIVLFYKGSAITESVRLFDHRDTLVFADEFNN